MMLLKFLAPRVHAQKEHLVPRAYVKAVQQEVYKFSKAICVDDKVPELLFCDYLTYGMTFLSSMRVKEEFYANTPLGPICSEIVKRYEENKQDSDNSFMSKFYKYLQIITILISKMNFRYYGFTFDWKSIDDSIGFEGHVYITSTQAPRTYFTYNQNTRPAYQLATGNFMCDTPNWLYIPHETVFPDNGRPINLSVYTQSHVMARMKERLDNQPYYYHSLALINSVLNKEIIKGTNGRKYLVCIDYANRIIGYFPIIVVDDKIILLTFLPLSSPDVPEGKCLHQALDMTKQDLKFLNMDKLSFYRETDFNTIPQLKAALIEAGIWHLTEIEPEGKIENIPFVRSAGVITKFFQQNTPEPNKYEVFDEIEKIY